MTLQFSRTQFPNGGWFFHDPRTGFTTPTPKSSTFDQVVRQIIQDRQRNPAAVIKHKLSVDPVNVGNELETYTRRRMGIPAAVMGPASVMLPGVTSTVVSTTDEIKKMALGVGILLAWERSQEGAVASDVAEARSEVCFRCPLNDTAKYEEWRKSSVGAAAISKTPRTNRMAVTTKQAANLGLCKATYAPCGQLCSIPMPIIATKMRGEDVKRLDSQCWVLIP